MTKQMNIEVSIPKDAPVMKAWEAFKARDEYLNTRKWALHENHVDGSLWTAFYGGFFAVAFEATQSPIADKLFEAQVEILSLHIKLAKAREALGACVASLERADTTEGVCCCGDSIESHSLSAGHGPVDMGDYYARKALDNAATVLKETEHEGLSRQMADEVLKIIADALEDVENPETTMSAWRYHMKLAQKVYTALRASGWVKVSPDQVVVPVEPTQGMCEAGPAFPAIHAIDDLPLAK